MKVFVNENNEIVALRSTAIPDLKETEIDTTSQDSIFTGKCDAFILGYKYGTEEIEQPDGTTIKVHVVTPYKDYTMLESIQQQYEESQNQFIAQAENNLDTDYRISCIELGVDSISYRK